jgi:hypothetical protein
MFGRTLALGIHDNRWAHRERPEGLSEIGFFDNRWFDPSEWKPYIPNTAFANLTDRDGYWAAKIISAFSSSHLEAIVHEAHYQDPRAANYLVRVLEERRDRIARFWFDRVPPLDFFSLTGEGVTFHDLGVDRRLYPAEVTRYRYRWAAVTEDREAAAWGDWLQTSLPIVPLPTGVESGEDGLDAARSADLDRYPFLALQCQVDRGDGWSQTVTVYLARSSGRIVALER